MQLTICVDKKSKETYLYIKGDYFIIIFFMLDIIHTQIDCISLTSIRFQTVGLIFVCLSTQPHFSRFIFWFIINDPFHLKLNIRNNLLKTELYGMYLFCIWRRIDLKSNWKFSCLFTICYVFSFLGIFRYFFKHKNVESKCWGFHFFISLFQNALDLLFIIPNVWFISESLVPLTFLSLKHNYFSFRSNQITITYLFPFTSSI